MHHGTMRTDGVVDHLWMRVADLPASKRFYETIAPHAGLRMNRDTPERVQFSGVSGTFSVLPGAAPTEHAHIALGVTSDESVDAFHRAGLAAGFADNGAPGERPEHHPGYYAAYLLDLDANNVEAVNHNRAEG